MEIEAPILKGQKQDGRQPGVSEIADTPEGDTVGTGERIRDPSGLPDAPERSVERGEETIVSQQDGKTKKEERVDVCDLKEFFFLQQTISFINLLLTK